MSPVSEVSRFSESLSPKFSASKTQYTVNLNGDVSSIKVNATAADSKAVVYGTGTKSLKPGKNTISVSVAAEDGSTKEYTITVNVDETPLVYVSFKGFRRLIDAIQTADKAELRSIVAYVYKRCFIDIDCNRVFL